MFVLSLSTGTISAATWTNAVRTLTADPATDAGAATLVWTHATRSLTTITNLATAIGTANGTCAASATIDLRPAAGRIRFLAIMGSTSLQTGSFDGTTFTAFSTPGALQPAHCASSIGWAIHNPTGGGLNYAIAGFDFQ